MAATAQAADKAAADKTAAQAALEQQEKQVDAGNEAAFGAPNLSSHKFPEAKLSILFPDDYQLKHSIESALAKVDYSSQVPQGLLTVSCVTLPPGADPSTAITSFNMLTTALIKQTNAAASQTASISKRGCPGREIMVGTIKGKPGDGAMLKIFLTGKYVYELSAVGKQSWLDSPAVDAFMTSFQFSGPTWAQWLDSYQCVHWTDGQGWEHWRDPHGLEHWWDAQYCEHWRDARGKVYCRDVDGVMH